MSEPFRWMMQLKAPKRTEVRRRLSIKMDQGEKNDFNYLWDFHARPEQLPPEGDWRVWMIMAGRGFGKTRSGAEWVRMIAETYPDARIALVSSSLAEARAVMVEGESGLMAICRPDHRPIYEPSLHRVRFRSGAQAQLFSAAEPEGRRGPQHSHACRASAERILRKSGALPVGRAPCAERFGVSGRPPATPSEGTSFRVTAPAIGDWSGQENSLAVRIGGAWHFIPPQEGMLVFGQSASQQLVFRSTWIRAAAPPVPVGGNTIDTQAREAVGALIEALLGAGALGPADT